MSNRYNLRSQDASAGTMIGACLGILAVVIAILFAVTFVFTLAWNAVVPSLFNGPVIQFWQSFALLIVVGILTSGFRGSRGSS